MQLVPITGNTYYIPDNTCIGVYIFPDKRCILFDSAANHTSARKILNLLDKEQLTVYGIINTHCHGDHCSGNRLIQDKTGCRIFAAPEEAILIENPLLQAYILYSASPPRILKSPYIMPRYSKVTDTIADTEININNQKFLVINTPGHSRGHNSYMTPDGVVFTGDCLIHSDILAEYPFVHLSDITRHLNSLEKLKEFLQCPLVAAHGGIIKNPAACWQLNQQIIIEVMNDYLGLLSSRAMSREELIQFTVQKRVIHQNHIQYYLTTTMVSAYLSYLLEQKMIRSFLDNGIMKFASSHKNSS